MGNHHSSSISILDTQTTKYGNPIIRLLDMSLTRLYTFFFFQCLSMVIGSLCGLVPKQIFWPMSVMVFDHNKVQNVTYSTHRTVSP